MTDVNCQTEIIDWNGIRIEVRYYPSWSDAYEETYGHPLAHLEIESIEPERAPLPVTETGYRSRFDGPNVIDRYGGAVAFVRAWLDEAAKNPEWIASEESRKQLSLF